MIIVCVRAGRKYGPEYVTALAAQVRQHVTVPYKFICLDDTRLPSGLGGWWAKLYMFAPDVFPVGERVLYLDLDTLIVANIDDVAAYDGPFAGLGDFHTGGGRWQSGVMAWKAGFGRDIWDKWNEAGRPMPGGGDQEWIASLYPKALRLNRIYPGIFSYKFHRCAKAKPKDGRIIAFHNEPRPHNCGGWAQHYWLTQQEDHHADSD